MGIGKISRIPIRDLWNHEAYDFTTWLRDNIDVLNDSLNMNLSSVENEHSVGSFNIDLVAEDDDGNVVVIENQLEKSDHDHLGKLITYLTAMDAKTAIWIVSEPRQEHVKAVSWLNEATSASFYLFKLEAIQIGDSTPAPLLTSIVEPSETSKSVGNAKKDMAERDKFRYDFWTQLLEISSEKTKLHGNISPSKYNWIGTGSGKRGLGFNYGIRKDGAQVELYIDRGKESDQENREIYIELFKHKEEIEKVFGGELKWEKLETKRACRISKQFNNGGYRDFDKYKEIIDEMVENMIKLEKSLAPYIKILKI